MRYVYLKGRKIAGAERKVWPKHVVGNKNRMYRYAPHNDVLVNDGPHIRRWFHNIIILYYNIKGKGVP